MSKKRAPLPICEIGSGDDEEPQLVFEGYKQNYNSIKHEEIQGRIALLLKKLGATNFESRVSTKSLCRHAGLKSARSLQTVISQEREFSPICTDRNGGIWLADPETLKGRCEIERCCGTIISRGLKTLHSGRNLMKFLED